MENTQTEKLWRLCQGELQEELSAEKYHMWIRPLQLMREETSLVLLAPNSFVRDEVNERYFPRLLELVRRFDPPDTGLSIRIGNLEQPAGNGACAGTAAKSNGGGNGKTPPSPSPSPIGSGLIREFTFDNYVEGKSNESARAAAMHVGEKPGKHYNPLVIYGGTGVGKTHLMHAVGHLILNSGSQKRVMYVHSERFIADMVEAIRKGAMPGFKKYYRSSDVLLLDDINFFTDKKRTQEEFFHIFNSLKNTGKQIVVTCDCLPADIQGMESRIVSRLNNGFVALVDVPDVETRAAILLKKAGALGVELSDDVAFLIAERIRSNVRELEGALNRIHAKANFTGTTVDKRTAEEALEDILTQHNRRITIENIQKKTAEYCSIRVGDLLSKSRKRQFVRPRQMAMLLAKEQTEKSLPEIGKSFGGRDHSTVLHACKKIKELMRDDPKVREDYENLRRRITG
ncbi:MAG: chromosomal replication initiator protein DnaA [Gammaproteobacteria bacterium]|nr:chromosomal replication initiator protein DnaA [Gammaproteobacteria bacterium]